MNIQGKEVYFDEGTKVRLIGSLFYNGFLYFIELVGTVLDQFSDGVDVGRITEVKTEIDDQDYIKTVRQNGWFFHESNILLIEEVKDEAVR